MADEFITATTLASYPGVTIPGASSADLIVNLTNGLIVDLIGVPDPVPTRVVAIALEVAARALRNPEGVESVTKGVDDWKKTIRYANAETLRAGVYLTDEERADLLGQIGDNAQVGSIRTRVPGYSRRAGYGLDC